MMTDTYYLSDLAIPPGEYLEEVLDELNITQSDLAKRMGRPAQAISEIVKGSKAITPETAVQLEQVLGVPAQLWASLEAEFRLILAKQDYLKEVEKEAESVKGFPYSDLVKLGLVAKTGKTLEKVTELRRFFGVSSLSNIPSVKAYQPAFRRDARNTVSHEALAAWLRVGQMAAEKAEVPKYDKKALRDALPTLRSMTNNEEPNALIADVRALLASCGVVLVLVPAFKGTAATGATFWHSSDKAVIMMSLRGSWADIFWFSLFHEIAHILLHDKRVTFLEDHSKDPAHAKQEAEADAFAQITLIPEKNYREFLGLGRFDSLSVKHFAESVGIHPGIVTGRLHHDKKLPYTCHFHRIRYKWQ
jgi:HTH-type transcriptional regulator/antitoxin HigA